MALLLKNGKLVQRGGKLMTGACCGYWSMEFVWVPSCADGVWSGAWAVLVEQNFTPGSPSPLSVGDNYNEDHTGCIRVGAQTCDGTTSNITSDDPSTNPDPVPHAEYSYFYALRCNYSAVSGEGCTACWSIGEWTKDYQIFSAPYGSTPTETLTNIHECNGPDEAGQYNCLDQTWKTSFVGPFCTSEDAAAAADSALEVLLCP